MSDTLRVNNIHFGNVASNYNQPQMGFSSVGIGSTTNYGFLQFFGTPNTLCWTANGTVGIGTTNPTQALQVYGNIYMGAGYRNFSLGGGNANGYLYGCFAKYGDGIHLGYNFYNDNTTNYVSNVGGATSRISLGYGFVAIYTGVVNTEPTTLGYYQDSNGYVGIGTNAPGSTFEVYTNGGVGGTTQLNVTSFAGAGTITNTSVLNLRIQGAGGGIVDNSISAQYNSSGVGTYSLAFKPFGTTAMTIIGTGNVGIGVTNPQAMLHVQGGTLVTNPTVYNTDVGGWFIIGYWDCSAAQNTGAHLKLRIMGCNGYDNSTDINQMGGETTIYLNNLNNLNTTTNANVDGLWKSEGGRTAITQVKAVQGSSRYQYFIYALVQSYTQHSITAETTQGTIWTSQFTSTSDPGANSLTVRVLTFSTAAVGTNVGIGTATPSTYLHISGPPASGATTGQLIQRMNTVFVPGLQYGQSAGFALCGGTTTSDSYGRLDILVNNTAVSGNNMGQIPNTTVASFCGNGNVGINTTNPSSTLQVNGTVTANLFTTQIQYAGAFGGTNTFTITIPYPASYLFSVNGNGVTINGGAGDSYAKAIIYVSIGSSGVVLTTVVQSVGVQINSYNTSNQQLSYDIGYGGGTIYGGGTCTVSVMRLV